MPVLAGGGFTGGGLGVSTTGGFGSTFATGGGVVGPAWLPPACDGGGLWVTGGGGGGDALATTDAGGSAVTLAGGGGGGGVATLVAGGGGALFAVVGSPFDLDAAIIATTPMPARTRKLATAIAATIGAFDLGSCVTPEPVLCQPPLVPRPSATVPPTAGR